MTVLPRAFVLYQDNAFTHIIMLPKKDSGCRDKDNAINMKIILITCFAS